MRLAGEPLTVARYLTTRANSGASIATLRQAGKPGKVALTSCMRKLLTIFNAVARDGQSWQTITPSNT